MGGVSKLKVTIYLDMADFSNTLCDISVFITIQLVFDNIGDLVPPVAVFWYR